MNSLVATALLWESQIPVLTFFMKLVFEISKEMYSDEGKKYILEEKQISAVDKQAQSISFLHG